jgi:hypothetical protein
VVSPRCRGAWDLGASRLWIAGISLISGAFGSQARAAWTRRSSRPLCPPARWRAICLCFQCVLQSTVVSSGSSAERIVWMAQAGGGVCVAIELVESQWMTKCYKRLPRKHSMTSLIRVISASKDTSDCIGFRRYGMETKHREKLGVRGDHAFQIESKNLVVGKFWFGGILIVNTSGLKSVHSSWESGLQTVRIFFSVRAGTAASSKQETVGVLRGH